MFGIFRRKPHLSPAEASEPVAEDAPPAPPPDAEDATSQPEPSAEGPESREAVSMATDRGQLIIDAAERAASGIRADAETQARRYEEEARRRAEQLTLDRIRLISQTSDTLLEQTRSVKAQSEELLYALQDAAAKITAAASDIAPTLDPPSQRAVLDDTAPAQPPAERGEDGDSPEPQRTPESDSPPPGAVPSDPGRAAEDPWLLATRMAVAGSSRDDIDRRLREVGVEDTRSILRAVLGGT
jgi:hypothetical protein